ncbi:MAG: hypothetical protein K0U59_11250, partial [Gammaproteobacteria bacterium]|nr:hypothetical protein [Gammaproteobacteria bacterium]
MNKLLLPFFQLLLVFTLNCTPLLAAANVNYQFTTADIAFLKRFTLAALPPLPTAADNAMA